MQNNSKKSQPKKKKKDINKHGYDVSEFGVLYIPVRRDPETGRLISTNKPSSNPSKQTSKKKKKE